MHGRKSPPRNRGCSTADLISMLAEDIDPEMDGWFRISPATILELAGKWERWERTNPIKGLRSQRTLCSRYFDIVDHGNYLSVRFEMPVFDGKYDQEHFRGRMTREFAVYRNCVAPGSVRYVKMEEEGKGLEYGIATI